MKFFKKFSQIICLLIAFGILIKSWHLLTDGFRIDKIQTILVNLSKPEKNISPLVMKILDQNFKYLAKGCQTYVFESEDHQYILKFVRFHRYNIPFWLRALSFFEKYKNKRTDYKTKLLNDSLNSYLFAEKYLQKETSVIYVHLTQTDFFNKKLEIKDRLFRKYLIDLDNLGFILQKKVKPFEKVLKSNLNDKEKLKELTLSFLQTTNSIYQKGFINDDYNCIKNAGVIDNIVVHSDLGSFLKRDNLDQKDVFEKEFYRFMKYFQIWARKNAPFLLQYVDQEIKNISSIL